MCLPVKRHPLINNLAGAICQIVNKYSTTFARSRRISVTSKLTSKTESFLWPRLLLAKDLRAIDRLFSIAIGIYLTL